MALLKQVWALRVIALVAALAAAVPVSSVSARFFPLVRRSIQIGMLPQHPGSLLVFNSCATIHINKMPPYCERVYSLPTPDPALGSDYPEAIAKMGWQVVSRYSGTGYDWYARKPMNIECYVYRTNVWGVDEPLVLAVLDNQWYRIMGGSNVDYCNRISKTR